MADKRSAKFDSAIVVAVCLAAVVTIVFVHGWLAIIKKAEADVRVAPATERIAVALERLVVDVEEAARVEAARRAAIKPAVRRRHKKKAAEAVKPAVTSDDQGLAEFCGRNDYIDEHGQIEPDYCRQ